MKKHLILATMLLAGLFIATTASSSQLVTLEDASTHAIVTDLGQDGLTLDIGVGAIQITEVTTPEGVFNLVAFEGCTRSHNLGKPNLPTVNRLISIPFGCELKVNVLSYEVEEISLSDLGIDAPLIPVQPSVSKSDDPASIPFEFNHNIYEQNEFYSLSLAHAEVQGTMRSVHLGLVSISPIEYNPVTNVLRVYKDIQVTVSYEHADWATTKEMQQKLYSPFFEGLYSKVSNYTQQQSSMRDDLVTYPVKYVIISDRMFEAQLAPFIEWKTKKGFNVIVAYTDVIGSSTSAVKTYLQGLYNDGTPEDPAPSFVLFVGDDNQIPAYTGFSGHISDLWVCEYTGDNFPEIYYGRFSAQNTSQLQPQIDKTLEYEQYLMPDPNYLEEVTLISGVDGTYAITYGNGQINYGTNLYYNAAHGISPHVWLYPSSDNPGASAATIQTVQDGVGFMNYTAHCGHSGQSNPSFDTDDVADLTNNHKYLLGIGNCCQANTFGSGYSTPCFGEAFVQKEAGGGIGYIGGTNSTYWDEDYWWGVGYGPVVGAGPTYEQTGQGAYDGTFHDHGEAVSDHYITNDAIIFAGNMAVTESGSSRTAYYWQIYHLMGDPSVMTYMGVPSVNSVTHPSALVFTSTTITVQATPGSYVGISLDGILHGAGYVDATGQVEITLDPFSGPAIADIVVTCQFKEPYTSTIQLFAPDGAYVVYDDAQTNDVTGNNNGILEAGETVLLGLELKNVGPDEAIDVVATISSTDPYISAIGDDTESYGSIPGNDGTKFIADGFSFTVSPDAPEGYLASFDLSVTGTNRDTWTGNFSLEIHRPNVTYLTVAVTDIGNGNGVLDPGETAELVVSLSNSGSGQATNTSAILSETDTWVSVIDDYGEFGAIDVFGGSASNTIDIFE
ncbi:MAG: hypothetical protein DRP47_01295, partial [Candidatus Zixiibacteriota bacterium]